jgi:hypothetical protein
MLLKPTDSREQIIFDFFVGIIVVKNDRIEKLERLLKMYDEKVKELRKNQ